MEERIPQTPPAISPLAQDLTRPLWSVMIPTYNCTHFLAETLRCVLQQDPGADVMQIEVVDDASTDGDVQALVQEIGKGRVKFHTQPQNRGSLRNFETCINRAHGHLVHLLHGDDKVKPEFYRTMSGLFQKFPEAGAAFCRYEIIDEGGAFFGGDTTILETEGIVKDFLLQQSQKQWVQYAGMVVKRPVYEHVGGFYAVTYGEDWEMWARIAQKYPVAYTPAPLAQYRMHFNSISSGSYRTGTNVRNIVTVLKTVNGYLPERERKRLLKTAVRDYSHRACEFSGFLWYKTSSAKLVFRQLFEILKVYRDPFLLKKTGKMAWLIAKSQLRYYKLLSPNRAN